MQNANAESKNFRSENDQKKGSVDLKTTSIFDITQIFGQKMVKALDDSNDSTEISQAGVFDLCDALSGSDNSKFSVEEAQAEMKKRGL